MNNLDRALKNATGKAIKLLKDRNRALRLLDAAAGRATGGVEPIEKRGLGDRLKASVRLVRSTVRREYRNVPWQSLVLITAGLIYFVSPIDSLPDLIPLLGFTDDAAILAAIFASVRNDLDRFIDWERSQEGATARESSPG
jgi:uncharacterized membrane protein YkvA (DUF1232 family)